MPEFHPTRAGIYVAGNAGDGGVVSSNDGRIVLGPSAGNVHIYNDTEAVCQYYRRLGIDAAPPQDPKVVAVDIFTGATRDLLLHGANKIVAGAGHWFADKTLDGVAVDYNVRAFAGDFMAWFPWNGTGLYIRKWSTGVDVQLSTTLGPEEPIQLFPDGSCIWAEGWLPHAYAINDFPLNAIVLSGGIGWLKGFKVNDVWWLAYQSYALASVVEHPATELIGYKQLAPNAFRLDVTTLTSLPQIILSKGAADAPQDVQIEIIDPTKKRIDLTAAAPIQKAPKISVLAWAPEIKAGVSWPVKFKDEGTETVYDFSKDAKDQLQIGATSSFGSDHTGAIRQLTVVGPPTPLLPEFIPMLKRHWLQPSIGSLDQAQITDSALLETVDVIAIPVQQIHSDTSTPQLGPNTYPNLVAAGFFQKLREMVKPLVVEMGSVKDGDCQAKANINGMQWAVQRVADAGGAVAGFSADEPITNSRTCPGGLTATADGHAAWTHAIRALGGMQVGLLEAWPDYVTIDSLASFLQMLRDRDAVPDYLHLDIFWDHSTDAKTAAFIKACQVEADRYQITLGIFVNSTKDPIATDAAHHANVVALAQKIHGICPTIAHVCVAAWACRVSPDPTHKTQNVPNNLGTAGLLDTFAAVREIFKDSTPPEPIPPPMEIDPMNYTLVDYVIRIKGTKPSADGKVTAILPDDRVVSIQPDGHFESRDSGANGVYEQAHLVGGLLLYEPIPPNPVAGINYRWAVKPVS